jgi:hypothetical protein
MVSPAVLPGSALGGGERHLSPQETSTAEPSLDLECSVLQRLHYARLDRNAERADHTSSNAVKPESASAPIN